MGKRISLEDVELRLRFDNLYITVEQINYGVFHDSVGRHRHGKSYYEAHLVCGGKGTLVAEDEQYSLKKGVLYMTGPDITHEQITDKDELMEEYCLGFEIKKPKNSRNTEASNLLYDTHFWIGEDEGDTEQLFEMLSYESLHRIIGYQNNLKNVISMILVSLVRSYSGSALSMEKQLIAPDDKRAIFVDNAFLWGYNTISLKTLSEALGLSERQTQRFLIKQYGKNFSELKKEARRNKAKELLDEGMPQKEVAEQIGYSDMRSFHKLVK